MDIEYDRMIKTMEESDSDAERDLASTAKQSAYKLSFYTRAKGTAPQDIADAYTAMTGEDALAHLGVDEGTDLEHAVSDSIRDGWVSIHEGLHYDDEPGEAPIIAFWEDT